MSSPHPQMPQIHCPSAQQWTLPDPLLGRNSLRHHPSGYLCTCLTCLSFHSLGCVRGHKHKALSLFLSGWLVRHSQMSLGGISLGSAEGARWCLLCFALRAQSQDLHPTELSFPESLEILPGRCSLHQPYSVHLDPRQWCQVSLFHLCQPQWLPDLLQEVRSDNCSLEASTSQWSAVCPEICPYSIDGWNRVGHAGSFAGTGVGKKHVGRCCRSRGCHTCAGHSENNAERCRNCWKVI